MDDGVLGQMIALAEKVGALTAQVAALTDRLAAVEARPSAPALPADAQPLPEPVGATIRALAGNDGQLARHLTIEARKALLTQSPEDVATMLNNGTVSGAES